MTNRNYSGQAHQHTARLAHVDSLRAIAALLVVVHHMAGGVGYIRSIGPGESFWLDVIEFSNFGRLGVIVFFAISGFVICASLKGRRSAGSKRFLISRFFRLYPAFWLSIILAILIRHFWLNAPLDGQEILGNIPMLYSLFDVKPILGLYWTLEVELMFYLLCLMLFLFGGINQPLVLFSTSCLFIGIQFYFTSQSESPGIIGDLYANSSHWKRMPEHIAIMLWGGLFRIWYDNRGGTVSLGTFKLPLVVIVAVLLAIVLCNSFLQVVEATIQEDEKALSLNLPYLLALAFFLLGTLYIRITHSFIVWLGTISYSIYLLHPFAGRVLSILTGSSLDLARNTDLFAHVVGSMAIAIIMAALVYHLIEHPAIRLGKKMNAKTTHQ